MQEISVNMVTNPIANIFVAFTNDSIMVDNIYKNISIFENSKFTNTSDIMNELKVSELIPPTFGDSNIKMLFTSNEVFSDNTYREFCSISGLNYQFAKANHFNINNQLNTIIKGEPNPTKELTCRATSKILIKDWQKFIEKVCLSTDPTKVRTKSVACALALALNNKYVAKSTEQITYLTCKYIVKEVGNKAIDIYMEWKNEANNSTKDMLLWLEFVHGTEGMMWLTNKINQI